MSLQVVLDVLAIHEIDLRKLSVPNKSQNSYQYDTFGIAPYGYPNDVPVVGHQRKAPYTIVCQLLPNSAWASASPTPFNGIAHHPSPPLAAPKTL